MGILDTIRSWFKDEPKPVTRTQRVPTAPPPAQKPQTRSEPNPRQAERRPPLEPQGARRLKLGTTRAFPDLPTRQIKIVGMGWYSSDSFRQAGNRHEVVIIAEPTNPVDPQAVAVTTHQGRKIGYIPKGTAHQYHDLIAKTGPIRVPCDPDGYKWWMSAPTIPALRRATK